LFRLNWIQVSVTVAALLAANFFHARLSRLTAAEVHMRPLIPTSQAIKLVSLGFDQVIADYYWLEFVSYVGDVRARQKDRYALASHYIKLITELDPNFVQAYWFAAFIVGGDQGRPREAADIIDFGIEHNADSWYLPFIGGVNQYLYAHDEVRAAKYYRQASKYPGAPVWLDRQAKILETKTPRLVKEAYSWLNIYDSAEEARVKEHAKEKSIWLWVQVYKNAPNEDYRRKAKETLLHLGIDLDALVKRFRR